MRSADPSGDENFPSLSILMASAGQRLGLALAVVALIWVGVAWAVADQVS